MTPGLAPAELAPWVLDGHDWMVSDDLHIHFCPICARARGRSPVAIFDARHRRQRSRISA